MASQLPPEAVVDTTHGLGFATWAAGAAPIALIFHLGFFRSKTNGDGGLSLILAVVLATATFLWLGVVSHIVPEPYLDEIFHIPQAQRYCKGKFLEWDDKITTPPGLYWLSVLIPEVAKRSGLLSSYACDPKTLRATSGIGLIILSYLALLCRREIEAHLYEARSLVKIKTVSHYAIHSAFNIALFPLLFFFSGLYYTDVVSTGVVLMSYLNHLYRIGTDRSSFLSDLLTITLGICGLAMRQTNVFWIVVFMGGLEAVHAVKTLRPNQVRQPLTTTLREQLTFFAKRYALGAIHDVPLHLAYPEDMLFTVVSLVVAAICNPVRIIRQIWPYVTVLLSFGGFVAWNGGVVLGDKSNHVATIHLAQMLYLWAFFGFFSLPLFLPYVVAGVNALRTICGFASRQPGTTAVKSSGRSSIQRSSGKETKSTSKNNSASETSPALSYPLRLLNAVFNGRLLWPVYLAATFVLSGLVVRYNTIIHPFTLADNRHYMFYIFRYTIRRAGWIRYGLILPYTLSRWLVWGTLSGCSEWIFGIYREDCPASHYSLYPPRFTNDPFEVVYDNNTELNKVLATAQAVDGGSLHLEDKAKQDAEAALAKDPLLVSTEIIPTSTGLIFLLATTLSLVTAPLVEPRYFIIPWVMWRLLVPAWKMHDHLASGSLLDPSGSSSLWSKFVKMFQGYDVRLILETAWFIAINLATGYIFLCKPYVWKAEDGSALDEGRLQRFMW